MIVGKRGINRKDAAMRLLLYDIFTDNVENRKG